MPVAGVSRNPLDQQPDRFQRRRQAFVVMPGRTPGLVDTDLYADDVAPGTIRRVFRQAVNLVLPAQPLSWSYNNGLGTVTRALRYKATSTYRGAGSDNTRYGAPRPIRPAVHRQLRPTLSAGNKRNLPTVRNRMASFGRRVPTLNPPLPRPRGSDS